MKLLFDFFPIILFFIAYKLFNIYVATSVAILAAFIQCGLHWLKHRRFELTQLISFVLILLLGSATLLLHNTMFIKWKPTAIYWVLALIFFGSQLVGSKSLLQRMMDNKFSLPHFAWKRLNISWSLFFAIMGFANLYVVYHYSTDAWVNFKLFGTLGLTILFVILQSFYLARYIKEKDLNTR